jgi:uncharacterized membrane protein YhaH (DUF805 family)
MKLWFKAKNYGWGWQPSSPEGWLFLLVFVVVFALNATRFISIGPEPTTNQAVWFVIQNIVLISVLLVVCYKKGEKPEWRWNGKPISKKK